MNSTWYKIAQRIVEGLGIRPGELIQVRDHAGRWDVLQEILLAIEVAGATPLPELTPAEYMQRVWSTAPRDYLTNWDRHRTAWLEQADRVLVLSEAHPEFAASAEEGFNAWRQATARLTLLEEKRRLPFMVVAVPTPLGSRQLGLPLDEFEAILGPALETSVTEFQSEITRVLAAMQGGQTITIYSGEGHQLQLNQGDRMWLSDDGYLDAADLARSAFVLNLPSGS